LNKNTIKRAQHLGGSCSGGTPVPFPNTAVKSTSADDSRKAKVGRRQDIVLFFFTIFLHTQIISLGVVIYKEKTKYMKSLSRVLCFVFYEKILSTKKNLQTQVHIVIVRLVNFSITIKL